MSKNKTGKRGLKIGKICTQLKKYPDVVNNIRIVTDNERLKRSEWNHKKQLENELTKRNR